MHVMYVGPVGAGKTFCAVADALKDEGDYIITNQPIDVEKLHAHLGLRTDLYREEDEKQIEEGGKVVKIWRDFKDECVRDARCGTLLIDEAPLWLDARKWDSLDDSARRKIIEHRKDDLYIVSTAQDVSFIDKVYRVLADEIRIVERKSLPIIGWIFPYSKRPTIICCHCGRVRRDGVGDNSSWWKKALGFGTYYRWDVFTPNILSQQQDAAGKELPQERRIGHGRRLFDIRIADVYDTSRKLSGVAAEALRDRRAARAPKTVKKPVD